MFQQHVKEVSPKWLIEDILPSTGITLVYGRSEYDIYSLIADWAVSIATGQAWLSKEIEAQKVLCVTNQKRLKQYISSRFQRNGLAMKDNLILISSAFQPTYKYSKRSRLLASVQRIQPSIVILDSRISLRIHDDIDARRFTEEFLSICTEIYHMYHTPVLIAHYDRLNSQYLQTLKDPTDTVLHLRSVKDVMYLTREKPLDLQCDIVQFKSNGQALPVI